MEVRHVTPSTNQERRLVLFFLLFPSLCLARSLTDGRCHSTITNNRTICQNVDLSAMPPSKKYSWRFFWAFFLFVRVRERRGGVSVIRNQVLKMSPINNARRNWATTCNFIEMSKSGLSRPPDRVYFKRNYGDISIWTVILPAEFESVRAVDDSIRACCVGCA